MSVFRPTLLALLAGLAIAPAANAAAYDYTFNFDYIGSPSLSDAEQDTQLDFALRTCDGQFGVQQTAISANYRNCMRKLGWKYTSRTRTKVGSRSSDPYFSSNVKLQPGHFIDHDTGLDCQNVGGASICTSPNGTVRYFDPEQGVPCTRTGGMAICTNLQ